MRAVVTGATGFLGGHVASLLCERGDEVKVTYRNPERLKHLRGLDVRRAKADVLDFRAMKRALRAPTCSSTRSASSAPARPSWCGG